MSKNTKLVVKDNALIEASFNLSLVEQRLMLLAIVEARELPVLTYETPIRVSVRSYADEFKVNDNTAYEALQDSVNTLFERQFTYYDKDIDERLKSRWIHTASYMDNKGHVIMYLTPVVIRMIKRLEVEFTKYLLNHVAEFKSKYSIRLFEIIAKWKEAGHTDKYSYADLRTMLGVEETEYKTMSLFKVNVLDKAVKEINGVTNIPFTLKYEQFKDGRIITHIMFKMKKKPIKKNDRADQNTVDMFADMTAKQINMFGDKLSRDEDFQSYYIAKSGDSTEQYAQDIKFKLLDPFYVESWMPYLEKLGFVRSSK
jgi:plasmid replication initiation protein